VALRYREYGCMGPRVVLVHGGPGAPGSMAPVARGLEDAFRVLEPFQRGSGSGRLTVTRHVEDLRETVEEWREGQPFRLVGHSWGAMLVLAAAAAHRDWAEGLVLIGCGTFDPAARARLEAARDERLGAAGRARLRRLAETIPDPDERMKAVAELLLPVYSFDPVVEDQEIESCDARAFEETWADMLRLQREGILPAAFAAIDCPVIMLHGTHDPHPGEMTRRTIATRVPHLEYRQWTRCGHYPWLERCARDEFFTLLRKWLSGVVSR